MSKLKTIPIMLVVLIFLFVPFNGCIENPFQTSPVEYTSPNTIVKRIGDIGFIADLPYSISLYQRATIHWDREPKYFYLGQIKKVDRYVSASITLGEPERQTSPESPRGTVNALNFRFTVGDVQNSYVAGNSMVRKTSFSFVDYKTTYLKEATALVRSNDTYVEPSIQLEGDTRTGEVINYAFVPPNIASFTFLDSIPSTVQPGETITVMAIDPHLRNTIDFITLKQIIMNKYGVELPDTLKNKFNPQIIKINTLDKYEFDSSKIFGANSAFTDNIIPTIKWDYNSLIDEVKSMITNNIATKAPVLITLEVCFEIVITNLRGEILTDTKIAIPIPLVLKSIESLSELLYNKYKAQDTTIGQTSYTLTTTNPTEILHPSLNPVPLKGKIPVFIPFKRVISHLKNIKISATGKGVKFADKYDTDKFAYPIVKLWGFSFPIMNAINMAFIELINTVKDLTGNTHPKYVYGVEKYEINTVAYKSGRFYII